TWCTGGRMKLDALFSLKGRRAVITGGNSGTGEAMARALGLAGADVLIIARRQPELDATVEKLQSDGITAMSWAADLTDPAAVKEAGAIAESKLTGVDIIVNAAGVNLRQPFCEVTPEAWQTQISLHLAAPFFLT